MSDHKKSARDKEPSHNQSPAQNSMGREELEMLAMEESIKKLAEVLEPIPVVIHSDISHPLLHACKIIYDRLNMTLTPPERTTFASHYEHLKEICRISNVRYRQVKLGHNWWKDDSRALLGFYEDVPVALVRLSNHYYIIGPEKIKVTAEVASKISPVGFTFYAPLPEGKITGFSIARFCLNKRKGDIITLFLIGATGAFVSLLPPFLTRFIFDKVIEDHETILLGQIILGLILVALSSAIFLLTRSYTAVKISQLIDLRLESAIWDRVLNLPAHFFRQFTVGNLIQRIFSVTEMREMVGQNAVKVILSGLFSLIYFLAMLFYSKSLAFIGLTTVIFGLAISAFCTIMKVSLERKILAINGDIRGLVVEMIGGIAKLRICGAENRAFAKWATRFAESKFLQIRAQKYQNVVTTLTAVLPVLSNALIFTMTIYLLSKSLMLGQAMPISIGSFIAFLAAYVPFSQAIFEASNMLIATASALPLWERASVILQAEPENTTSKTKPGILEGNVDIDHVSFRYDAEAPLTLTDISLSIRKGEMVALVGSTGCGKSTLVRLLLGFETPESGDILYDKKDLSELDVREVRRQIGTVLQNGSLLSGSLYENIVCGGIYTQEEIDEALHLSGFEEDLQNLPMGLNTIIQSGGGTFSVGQAQRLLICRALISKPALLIFDEATSALDNKSQDQVTANLNALKATRLIIAHRLSTVKTADRIYVMDHGKIVQSGTFEELKNNEGLFRAMLTRQTL